MNEPDLASKGWYAVKPNQTKSNQTKPNQTKLGQVFWSRLDEPFLSQSCREFCAPYFLTEIMVCTYSIYQTGHILNACKISFKSFIYQVMYYYYYYYYYWYVSLS